MALVTSDHQALLFDTAERAMAGVEALITELIEQYEAEYLRQSRTSDDRRLRQLTAGYEARMRILEELHAAYEAIPARHAEMCESHDEAYVHVQLTIELARHNLRLRNYFDTLRRLS